jgi:cytochrome c biogenesis protein CcmG, thiol:disulfide interchange protein DsbE
MRRWLGPVLVVVGVIAIFVVVELISGSGGGSGQKSPPLPPTALRGKAVDLADLRGKPALINFWASWCKPCREEAPELLRFSRSLHGRANLVGVDYTDDEGSALSFAHDAGWRYPLLRDPNGVYGDRFHFNGLPATVVLDSRGRIVKTMSGAQTYTTLNAALKDAEKS